MTTTKNPATESASKLVKKAGLDNLRELSSMSGVAMSTLNHWHNTKPVLFRMVIKGAAFEKMLNGISL